MLLKSLLGIEVPAGGLPIDLGIVVNNVGTVAQLGKLLPQGEGLIERVVTVTGSNIEKAGNYLMPIGTPVRFILEQLGITADHDEIILGGPMMGMALASLDVPITKGTSGLLIFKERTFIESRANRAARYSLASSAGAAWMLARCTSTRRKWAGWRATASTRRWKAISTSTVALNAAVAALCARRISRWCNISALPRALTVN